MNAGSFILTVSVFGALIYFLSNRSVKQAQSGMGKLSSISAHPEGETGVTFNDVAGIDEVKESIRDIIDFIKNPEKYVRYGARLPRGVILYGPPGTGKTLVAKAVAGEAGGTFLCSFRVRFCTDICWSRSRQDPRFIQKSQGER